ncbi:Testis-expressed sequence 10 protein [Thoreauomyces humboldtii]|nr:Testis-expressed sequence 10 protein [Thoreauomyces humboldtii]
MPKAMRRKKLKAADFQKKNFKVGKKIAPAANDTEASFKSQAIVVPTQKLGEAKPASELVNSRNQSLRDLIIQLRHYSAQSRKDALSGMRDLQNHQPDAFRKQLSLVFEASAPVMVDEEMSVRKSLVALYKDFVPTVTKEHVRPFMALIMAYTCAAMTHISEHIRLDGLKFLTI